MLVVLASCIAVSTVGIYALPYLARARVVSVVSSRFNVDTTIGKVKVGLSTIGLNNIQIKTPKGNGLVVEVERLVVRSNLFALLLNGFSSVTSLEVFRLHTRVGINDPSLNKFLAAFRRSTSPRHKDGSSKKRSLSISSFSIQISDQKDVLISIVGRNAKYSAEQIIASLDRVEVGTLPDSVISLSDIQVVGKRTTQRFKFDRVDIGDAKVVLAEQRGSLTSNFINQSKETYPRKSKETGCKGKADQGNSKGFCTSDHDSSAITNQEASNTFQSKGNAVNSATLSRLKRAVAWIGGARKNAEHKNLKGQSDKRVNRASFLGWFTENARLELSNTTILVRKKHQNSLILKDLHSYIQVKKGSELHLKGEGNAANGGVLYWDLKIWPAQLRADGRVDLKSLPLTLIAPLLPDVPWYMPGRSLVDAGLILNTESIERIAVRGSVRLKNAALFSVRVAPQPVRHISFNIKGNGWFFPLKQRLKIDQAEFRLGKAKALLSGELELMPDHYFLDIDARLPKTECKSAVNAIPRDLLQELTGFELNGQLEANLRLRLDSRDLDSTIMKINFNNKCEFVMVPALADLRRFRMPFIHRVLESDGNELQMEMGPGTRDWTYLEEVSPFLVHAVIAHEDTQFFQHSGFSPAHIRNAIARNLREGRYVVGASTISMQLVKNLFLKREKTLARKIQEVLLTWWVERVMEKRDILELYLNVIEYGPRIYGIRKASKYYFNRLPSDLSPAESIFLANILPNPKRYHIYYERHQLSSSFADRLRRMLLRMGDRGWYTQDAVQYGLQELSSFHFYSAGKAVPTRDIPGTTSPLPYMENYEELWEGPHNNLLKINSGPDSMRQEVQGFLQ